MNGIGLAEKIRILTPLLLKLKSLLNPGGQILIDSTDVKYLFEDEDGSFLINLNSDYYGEFNFRMKYKNENGNWFNWLYVDADNLKAVSENCGFRFNFEILGENDNFLVSLNL